MYVFVHIDADPDNLRASWIRHGSRRNHRQTCPFKWNGLSFALSFFERFCEKMEKMGFTFKPTFFLRADKQIKDLCGTYSDAFLKFHDDIQELYETGWHPHLYRWSDGHRCWYQEFRDNGWMRNVLTECFDDLKSHGFYEKFSKMGWCFHNNATMKTLSDLGISADFSALPGAKRPGHLIDGVSFQDKFDWEKTKPKPYHPSESNYQEPRGLKILEIPLTTFRVDGLRILLYTMKLAFPLFLRSDFSYLPSFRVMTPLSLQNLVNMQNLEKICGLLFQENRKAYITLYLHPSELLDANKRTIFEKFILRLFSVSEKHDNKTVFIGASELYNMNIK